ncbi:MAG: hypothetical protein PHY45_04310 [Rhodocyclaceae bacterium]|nr:hypothetical protein [Rhodocyclaceae bacterium]
MRDLLARLRDIATNSVEPVIYRLAPILVLSLIDDPAMLALAFC